MFDFEWTNRALFYGAYRRSESYYPNSEFSATGKPEGGEWLLLSPYRKQLPAKLFSEPFQLPQTDGRGIPRDTLRRALGLLAEAGWKPSDAGLLNSAGQPLRFEILLVNPRLERILQPYVENLARIGIQANLRTVDGAQYKQRLDHYDYDMILMTLVQSLSPGIEQHLYFHSSQVDVRVDALCRRRQPHRRRPDRQAARRADPRRRSQPPAPSTGCCCGTTTPFRTGSSVTIAWRTGIGSPTSPRRPTRWVCAPGG